MQTTNVIRRFGWLVALVVLALPLAPSAPRSQAATVQAQMDWGQMPLYFVANQGQMDGRVAVAATLTVNTLSDENDGSCTDGDCSLRDAVQVATADDTINFGVTGTIVLSQGEILIDKDLTISGPGADKLAISGNDASRVFEAYADVNISGVTIANAYVGEIGGGIFNRYSKVLDVSDCVFSGNDAQGGGAIYNGGTLTVTHCTFSDNTASLFGGGAILSDYTTTVTTSTFLNNVAVDTDGGAIASGIGALVDVGNSTFAGNSGLKGGAIWSWGIVFVTSSTFSNNTATTLGGGIYCDDYLRVTNSTFANNTAQDGGGIYNSDDLILFNCTFSGNSASREGGGVFNSESGQFASNTIIASSPSGGNCNFPGMFSQGTVINLTTDDTCGDKFTVTTAEALQLSWQGWLYALLPGSAAIDAGYSPYCPATDQRGVTRPRDGNGDGTVECDIGSYEALWMSHRVYLPLVVRSH
jgi:CSLREA domain-containing protein